MHKRLAALPSRQAAEHRRGGGREIAQGENTRANRDANRLCTLVLCGSLCLLCTLALCDRCCGVDKLREPRQGSSHKLYATCEWVPVKYYLDVSEVL